LFTIKRKMCLVSLSVLLALVSLLSLPVYLRGDPEPESGPVIQKPAYAVGQDVPPNILDRAVSLSAGQKLVLDDTFHLFFSNVPEMPTEEGILCRVDDVLSPSGMVRVLFSHMNLLIDWTARPLENMPATAGFSVNNNTRRVLEVYATRSSMAASRATDGEYLFKEDEAPLRPGDREPLYFGTATGNWLVQQWFLSEARQPVLLGSIPPGGRTVVKGEVGPRGWIAGIYDLKFVDAGTGRAVGKKDLQPGEAVGVRSFIAPHGADIDSLLDRQEKRGSVLPLRANDMVHMRGLFIPGVYPDNPAGESVSKRINLSYDAAGGKAASFALAAGESDQGEDPSAPCYTPDVFLNDRMRNGYDPFARGVRGVNGGNYGVDYTVNLSLAGPVALVLQGASHPDARDNESFIDLYNQIVTFQVDGKVSTVQLRDPNYDKYYTDFSSLRPPGYGKVVEIFPEPGSHPHTLRFTLPPNGYGPVRFYLLPLYENSESRIQNPE